MFQDVVTTTINPEDERRLDTLIQGRRAEFALSISKYIALFGTIMLFLLVGLWLFLLQQYTQLPAFAILVTPVVVSAWLYPVFHRRGQATVGIYLFLASLLFLFATGSIFVLPEALLAAVPMYVFFVILSSLLLEAGTSRWLAMACVAIFAVVVTVVSFWSPGWFPHLDETLERFTNIIFSVFALLAAAIMIRRVVLGQEETYRQSQQANLEIERRAAAEREQREYLQTTVQKYVDYMAEVEQGNLAARLPLGTDTRAADDPLMVLGLQLNATTASLQRMITQIRDAANNLSAGAAEILAATTQQVTGANEQSAAIAQTTTTVDEVMTIAEQSVARAQEVTDMGQRTVQVSRGGQQAVDDTTTSMDQIKVQVEGIAEHILTLSEHTQQIGAIITTVGEIATQSNMLALNAAVEAARAGEHGKGFAVVAQEVRSLAEQSKQATAQVRSILEDIQQATNATVMATEEGTKKVDEGVKLTAQTGSVIAQLTEVIGESAQAATQMVTGGRQQASGIEQIALAMQSINQVTLQGLTSTRQAEKAAQDLNTLARTLTETVEQYQL